MDLNALGGGRVQYLQAQLFPICTLTTSAGGRGFLGSFLSKGLKTNQLELNTDEKTLRPIARLKEPRDLFALPKDKDHDFAQQAPRWPIECQVIEERIFHIPYVHSPPEPYNTSVGELKPRPVGEENGIVVFNYNPISAVNYEKPKTKVFRESSDSDISSSESRGSSPDCDGGPSRRKITLKTGFSKLLSGLHRRSSSNSNEEYDEDDDDDDDDDDNDNDEDDIAAILTKKEVLNGLSTGEKKKERAKSVAKDKERSKSKDLNNNYKDGDEISTNATTSETLTTITTTTTTDEIDDIWANNSPEYPPATPTFIKSRFGHKRKSGSPVDERLNRVSVESAQSTDAGGGGDMGASGDGDKEQIANIDATNTLHETTTTKSPDQTPETAQPETKTDKKKPAETVAEPNENGCTEFNTEILKLNEEILEIINSIHREEEGNQEQQQKPKPICEINLEAMIVAPLKIPGGKLKSASVTPRVEGGDDRSTGQNIAQKNINNTAQVKIKLLSEDPKEAPQIESDKLNNTESLSPPQFSRSAVGGSKILTNCHPYNPEELECLEFESRFESGNLAKAVKITTTYYELYLRSDLYTSRSKQWFYFRVRKMQKGLVYRFSIVNLVKSDSLYNDGMRPLMYSCIRAKQLKEGWRRCGENICYYRNEEDNVTGDEDEENSSYTLTFNIEFFHDDDTVYFAHSYPYTYSDLQDYLMDIQKHPVKSKFCKLRMLCRSLAGNNVYYLTVTAPTKDEEAMKRKKSIVVSARVHPSETPASWMMKGLMDYITGDSVVAKRLRHKFIFKLIPMLNPDGVIVGNTRNSLTGKDLNRQYRTVIRETYPSIWYTKAMIKRLIDECGVAMYCDMHAHSRKHNIFIYGCENKRDSEKKLMEQVFPLMMHKNIADKFSFESSKFKVQRNKEGTGRIVVWMLGITNSYTIEASFGGSSLGLRKGTHFNTADYEHIGRGFCETLLDYSDEHPNKERLRLKIIERLLKEGSSADEPLNIPLSDYSSDEGRCSSNSGNEESSSMKYFDFEGPCCAPLKAPPCSPEVYAIEKRRFYFKRMRKILRELDRIYFQPLYHKKYQAFLNYKQKKQRMQKKSPRKIEPEKRQISEIDAKENDSNDLPKQVSPNQTFNYSEIINKHALTYQNQNQTQTQDPIEIQEKPEQIQEPAKPVIRKARRKVKEKKDPFAEIVEKRPKVSRKFRMFLESRNIKIYRKPKRKNRRTKLFKQSRLNKEAQRSPIDLPTTDPGSDIHFSTDEEEELCGDAANNNSINASMPRSRKILMQSELQRRYIEEIGDGSAILKRMPPELIVTSPSKPAKFNTPNSGVGVLQKPPTTAPVSEKFPRISAGADLNKSRRTNSWHNLHHSAGKAVPKIRLQNQHTNPLDACNNRDELQLKLSLKKKIWSGLSPEPPSWMERNRPLSWGMPPMTQTAASYKTEKVTTRTMHGKNRDHNEALLSACTEKLLAWQQVTSTTSNMPGAFPNSPARNKMMLNLVVPEINMDDRTLRVFHQLTSVNYEGTFDPPKLGPDQVKRIKKKKNAIAKVAESTQLLSRLSKSSKSRSSFTMLQRAKASSTSGRSFTQVPGKPSTSYVTTQKSTNRFKTSGIVVTAVQPSNTRRNNRLRALNNTSNKPPPPPPASSKVAQQTKINNQQVPTVPKLPTQAQIVRRLKLKPKKKVLATNAAGAGASAAGDNVPAATAPAATEHFIDDNKSKPKDIKN